jgi:hypothetical protein
MSWTNIKKSAAVAFVACSMGFASQASALSIGDSYYMGYINDGIPSSTTNEATYINNLADLAPGAGPTTIGTETYTRSSATLCYPSCPDATGGTKNETGSNTGSYNGATYLLAKYDGPNYGSVVWYVAGLTGSFVLPTTAGGYGLSHYTLFGGSSSTSTSTSTSTGTVSEPGTSAIALLGLGLLGAALRSRRRAK